MLGPTHLSKQFLDTHATQQVHQTVVSLLDETLAKSTQAQLYHGPIIQNLHTARNTMPMLHHGQYLTNTFHNTSAITSLTVLSVSYQHISHCFSYCTVSILPITSANTVTFCYSTQHCILYYTLLLSIFNDSIIQCQHTFCY